MSEVKFHEYRQEILKMALQKNWEQEAEFLENLKPDYLLSENQRAKFSELFFKLAYSFSHRNGKRVIVAQHFSGNTTYLVAKMLAYVSIRYRRPDIYAEFSLWTNQKDYLDPIYKNELALENQRGVEKRQMSLNDFYSELASLFLASSDEVKDVDFIKELTPSRILMRENLDRLAELNLKFEKSGNSWIYTFYRPLARILSFACLEYNRPDVYAAFVENVRDKDFFLKVFFEELSFEHVVNQFGMRRYIDETLEVQIQAEKLKRPARGCFLKLQN